MKELNDALRSQLVLALPSSTAHMTLDKDACDKQARCILLQKHNDETVLPFGYQRGSPNNAEKRPDNKYSKFLAIARSVLMLRP